MQDLLEAYAARLHEIVPSRPDIMYQTSDAIAPGQVVHVHVSALGFGPHASPKPLAEASTCRKLAAEILQDGFQSELEPLICVQPPVLKSNLLWTPWVTAEAPDASLPLFSLGYVKGQARSVTMLSLLMLCIARDVNMDLLPFLVSSASAICVRVEAMPSKLQLALENAKLSTRGAIRKAPSIVTWVSMIRELQKDRT